MPQSRGIGLLVGIVLCGSGAAILATLYRAGWKKQQLRRTGIKASAVVTACESDQEGGGVATLRWTDAKGFERDTQIPRGSVSVGDKISIQYNPKDVAHIVFDRESILFDLRPLMLGFMGGLFVLIGAALLASLFARYTERI